MVLLRSHSRLLAAFLQHGCAVIAAVVAAADAATCL